MAGPRGKNAGKAASGATAAVAPQPTAADVAPQVEAAIAFVDSQAVTTALL